MKKTFIIEVEYPDGDFIASSEVIEVAQECIEQYMERYFGANIMDGDYGRIKVAQSDLAAVYEGLDRYEEFLGLVAYMRTSQKIFDAKRSHYYDPEDKDTDEMYKLMETVDKWLEGEAL